MSARERLAELHRAALDAVHAGRAVSRSLARDDPGGGPFTVLAAGKASCAMAQAAVEALGPRVSRVRVVTKAGHARDIERASVYEAAHPFPDERSVREAEVALREGANLRAGERLLVLLSGGASSLWCAPAPGLSLEDKREVTRALLGVDATIVQTNAVRKHLSRIKGGGLARAVLASTAARALEDPRPGALGAVLAVSDVPGDGIDAIGSGPTCADPTTYRDAMDVLQGHGLIDHVPRGVVRHLGLGCAGRLAETVKPGEIAADVLSLRVVACLEDALLGVALRARAYGEAVHELGPWLHGRDVHAAALDLAQRARCVRAQGGGWIVAGGEPVVRIRGAGRGGRCQELALAFALAIAGERGIHALFAGTDGTDGPTDAAGAFADGETVSRALPLDARDFLRRNDSHSLLHRLGDLYVTGPTDTNVTDLALLWVDAEGDTRDRGRNEGAAQRVDRLA